MLERFFGKKGQEQLPKEPQRQAQQPPQLSRQTQETIDALGRPTGTDAERLDMLANQINAKQKEIDKRQDDILLTQPVEPGQPGQREQFEPRQTLESLANGNMPRESVNDRKALEEQQKKEQGQQQIEPEPQINPDQMMAEIKQELITKYKLSPQEAEKLSSIYTRDLDPAILENTTLQQQLKESLKIEIPRDPGQLRRVLVQSLFSLAISGAFAAYTGNYIFLAPTLLFQGYFAYSKMTKTEQAQFINTLNTQKKNLNNLSNLSKAEIDATLAQLDKAIKSKQSDPAFFEKNIAIIRSQNAKLAEGMERLMAIKARNDDFQQARIKLAESSLKPEEIESVKQTKAMPRAA